MGRPVYVKFQILSNSFNTSVVTFPCSVQFFLLRKERFNLQFKKHHVGNLDLIRWWLLVGMMLLKKYFWPPPHHMLELPYIHSWEYSIITGVGISDDSLTLSCLPQNCLPVDNSEVGISEGNRNYIKNKQSRFEVEITFPF